MPANNPHHEEQDGCDHGNTGVECRPDPSTNGQDCAVHGNHGGINEDHCLSTDTTTTTTTTLPTSTTTTTTGGTESTPTTTTSTTTTTSPSSSTPVSTPVTTDPISTVTTVAQPKPLAELPFTGAGTDVLVRGGTILLIGGVLLRVMARRRA